MGRLHGVTPVKFAIALLLTSLSVSAQLWESAAFQSSAGFNPTGVSPSTISAWWEASALNLNDGDAIATWPDSSGNLRDATQTSAGAKPHFKTNGVPSGLPVVRFDGTSDFMTVLKAVMGRTVTNWTVSWVAKSYNQQQNNTVFDITDSTGTASILTRNIFLASTFSVNAQSRDNASNSNVATTPNDMSSFVVCTSTRNGNEIKLRVNGTWVSTNSAATIGSMAAAVYYVTIGAVQNNFGSVANYMQGDIYGISVYISTLSDYQISALERYWIYRTTIPPQTFTRNATNPVIPLGAAGTGDGGRILEPTAILDGSTWKMWYCGITNNGAANLGSGWNTFYATSSDGSAWTKQGIVKSGAWEPDVIKVSTNYYMAHVTDASFNVRLSTSTSGTNWTDLGEIINLTNSVWSDIGPREPCLYYESGTYYCYYADHATADGFYKLGVSVCSSDPTVLTNWVCQTTPLFSAESTAPRWNQGGDTESPCVRKYAWLPHPYLMTFIGYNPLTQGAGVAKTWRPGFAYADNPLGPWTECRYDPLMTIGTRTGWDGGVIAEMSHLESAGTMYFYYSGGTTSWTNQVGLATISTNQITKWLQW